MHKAFDGTPTPAPALSPIDEAALPARVFEWKLPGAIVAHDTEFDPADGKLYTPEQNIDQVYVTDPTTNKTEIVPIPALEAAVARAGNALTGAHSIEFSTFGQYMALSRARFLWIPSGEWTKVDEELAAPKT